MAPLIRASLVLLSLTASSVSAQVPTGVSVRHAAQVQSFSQTPEGDWTTTIKGADGTEGLFRYSPPNKIQPPAAR